MKSKEEILMKVKDKYGIGIAWQRTKPIILEAMEEYAQMKVNELNKSDVIKSVCECKIPLQERTSFALENGCLECGKKIATLTENKKSQGNSKRCQCNFCKKYEFEKWATIMECPCGCHTGDGMTGHDGLCCAFPNGLRKNNPYKNLEKAKIYRKRKNISKLS